MTRPKRTVVAAAFVLATGMPLVLTSGPAAGGVFQCTGNATNAPDGKIRIDGQAFTGVGVYPSTFQGGGQVSVGESVAFTLKWKNVSASTSTIRVQLADQVRDPGYGVRYRLDGVNVTDRVKQGKSLVIRGLAPGDPTPPIGVVIRNRSGANGSSIALYISGRYGGTTPQTCDMLGPQANVP